MRSLLSGRVAYENLPIQPLERLDRTVAQATGGWYTRRLDPTAWFQTRWIKCAAGGWYVCRVGDPCVSEPF